MVRGGRTSQARAKTDAKPRGSEDAPRSRSHARSPEKSPRTREKPPTLAIIPRKPIKRVTDDFCALVDHPRGKATHNNNGRHATTRHKRHTTRKGHTRRPFTPTERKGSANAVLKRITADATKAEQAMRATFPPAFVNSHFLRYLFIKISGLYIFLYFSLLTFFSFLCEVAPVFALFTNSHAARNASADRDPPALVNFCNKSRVHVNFCNVGKL